MAATDPILRLTPELVEAVEAEGGEGHTSRSSSSAPRATSSSERDARRFLDELGPVDESLVEHFDALFAQVDAANTAD